jgi:hypothetical protein
LAQFLIRSDTNLRRVEVNSSGGAGRDAESHFAKQHPVGRRALQLRIGVEVGSVQWNSIAVRLPQVVNRRQLLAIKQLKVLAKLQSLDQF